MKPVPAPKGWRRNGLNGDLRSLFRSPFPPLRHPFRALHQAFPHQLPHLVLMQPDGIGVPADEFIDIHPSMVGGRRTRFCLPLMKMVMNSFRRRFFALSGSSSFAK